MTIVIFEDDESNLAAYDLQKTILGRKGLEVVILTNVVDGFRWLVDNAGNLADVKSFVFDYDLSKGYPEVQETAAELADIRYSSNNSLPLLLEIRRILSEKGLSCKLIANSGTNNLDLLREGCKDEVIPPKDFNQILFHSLSGQELETVVGGERLKNLRGKIFA